MKIGDVVLNETVEKRDRNAHIIINCPLETAPEMEIRCLREVVLTKDGKRISTGGDNGERTYTIDKKLSEIAALEVTVGGVTMTGAQIAAFVEALSDRVALGESSSSSA